MEDWENMLHFAVEMLIESNNHFKDNYIDQRIAIMHLDHATELLMKAFLIKKGYFIYDIDKSVVRKGIKTKDLPNSDRLLSFTSCLNIVSKVISLDPDTKSKVLKFHRIRNEIQHRAIKFPFNKKKAIENFSPALDELYPKIFPEFKDDFPKIKPRDENGEGLKKK